MKTTLLYLFLSSTLLFNAPTDWYTYKDKDFSIEFPKEPKVESQKVPTAIGELDMQIISYEESEKFAFVFISTAYPDSLVHSDMKDKVPGLFRGAIDGAVRNVEGKLLSEKEVKLDSYPGREVMIDYGDGAAIIICHMYLVKNKMYMLQTITETGKEKNESSLRFHDSFKLKGK